MRLIVLASILASLATSTDVRPASALAARSMFPEGKTILLFINWELHTLCTDAYYMHYPTKYATMPGRLDLRRLKPMENKIT
jgi:hypothetical protein